MRWEAPAIDKPEPCSVGGAFQKRSFNVGAEAGVKWCLGPIGHLNFGAGVSVGSPPHATIGLGLNSLPIELLILLAGS